MGCPRRLPTLHGAILQQLLHDLLLLQAQSLGGTGAGTGTPGTALPTPWGCRQRPFRHPRVGVVEMPNGGAAPLGAPQRVFPSFISKFGLPRETTPSQAPFPLPTPNGSCFAHAGGSARPRPAGTHAGGEAVGRGGLVDLVGVGLGVGAACRRLPLAPARGAAVHHAGLCRRLALLAGEGVALVCHHPGRRDKDMRKGRTTRFHPHSHPQTPLSIPTWAGSPRSPPAQGTALGTRCAWGTPGLSPREP